LVSKTYDELLSIRIPANPAAQGAAVQKKLSILNRLKDELKTVVAYDDAGQIVAALARQGQALQHMYMAISDAPIPKGLKPEELKQYKDGVQKIAEPFKSQAIEAYRTAIQRGHELQGYNEFLLVALKNLSQLTDDKDAGSNTKVILTKVPDWMGL
jgi:soluble cytochrome b562